MNWSSAVTVKVKAAPAVALAGALMEKCVAVAVLTTATLLLTPVMPLFALSAARSTWLPTVLSVAVKVPTPFVRPLLAGSTAWPSLLLKCTVPV